MAVKQTISFEDKGQDFLEWDLDQHGNVVDCRPCQASIWTQYIVLNHQELQVGARVLVQHDSGREEPVAIKYPLRAIEQLEKPA